MEQELAARSLVGTTARHPRRPQPSTATCRPTVSGTLNTELEHIDGRSLIGLNPTLLEPLARNNYSDTAHIGVVVNGQTKSQWHWTVTGNGDLAGTLRKTDQDNRFFRATATHETTASADLTGTANGTSVQASRRQCEYYRHARGNHRAPDQHRTQQGTSSSNSLSRTTEQAAINLDLPISRRGREFSALGNLTLNGNAEVDHFSDFGTLTDVRGRPQFLARRTAELHHELDPRGGRADDQSAWRSCPHHSKFAHLRFCHRTDGSRHR